MSVHYSSHVWKQETDVHGTHLLALLAYADMANDDGLSWGSKAHIAARIRRSPTVARNITNELEAAHKIVIVSRERATDHVIVVAPEHNGTYEEVCQKHKVASVEYIPLPQNRRGGNFNSEANLGRVLSLEGGGTELSTGGLLSLGDESSVEPSIETSSSAITDVLAVASTVGNPSDATTSIIQSEDMSSIPAKTKKQRVPRRRRSAAAVAHSELQKQLAETHYAYLNGTEITSNQYGRYIKTYAAPVLAENPDLTLAQYQAFLMWYEDEREAYNKTAKAGYERQPLQKRDKLLEWLERWQRREPEASVPTRADLTPEHLRYAELLDTFNLDRLTQHDIDWLLGVPMATIRRTLEE